MIYDTFDVEASHTNSRENLQNAWTKAYLRASVYVPGCL